MVCIKFKDPQNITSLRHLFRSDIIVLNGLFLCSQIIVLNGLFLQSDAFDLLMEAFFPQVRSLCLLKTAMQKKRSSNAFSHASAVRLRESDSLATSIDPKEDHNYSASSMAAQRCASRSSVSSLSSVDEVYEFNIPKSSHVGSDGSEGFRAVKKTQTLTMKMIHLETVAMHRRLAVIQLKRGSQTKRCENKHVKKLMRSSKRQLDLCSTLLVFAYV